MPIIDKSELAKAIQKLTKEQLYPSIEWADEKRGRCPYHQSKSGNSFTVTQNKRFHCAGCGVSGDPVDYLYSIEIGKLDRCPSHRFTEYGAKILEMAEVNVKQTTPFKPTQKITRTAHKPSVLKDTAEYTHRELLKTPEALNYLKKRMVGEETIKRLQVGYYLDSSQLHNFITTEKNHYYGKGEPNGVHAMDILHKKYNGYLTFPWLNETGKQHQTMYFRYAGTPPEEKPKTLALPGEGSKSTPLFLHNCLQHNHTELLAMEGVIDALSLIDSGLNNVVAYVGASFSNEQIAVIRRCGIKSVTIIPDADEGGQNGLKSSVIRLFNSDIDSYSCLLPDGLDPNDFLIKYGFEKWQDYTKKTKSALSAIVDNILAKYSDQEHSNMIKNRMINEVRDFTKKLETNEGSRITKVNLFVWDYLYTHLGLDRREI